MSVLINEFKKICANILVMIINCLYTLIIWIIIDKFSPNDYAMATIIEGITGKIFNLLIHKSEFNIGISIFYIIIYFILIFGICIHNEIIIINKYRLNEYTKKKLGKKGDEDLELTKDNTRNSSFFDEENTDDKRVNRSNSEVVKVNKNKEINLIEKPSNSMSSGFIALQNMEHIHD